MDFMPLLPFLGVSVPESMVLYYMVLVITGKKESPLLIISLSLLTSLFSYAVRAIPIAFGIHTYLQIVFMIIFLGLFFRLPWRAAIATMIIASIALGLAEGIFVPLLGLIFSLELKQIISDPLLRIVFTLPHLIILAATTYIINKRQWRLPLVKRLVEGNISLSPTAKSRLRNQAYLFILCLVQALMLILLRISYYIYTSGVYPSFTLGTLTEINTIVIVISVFATIFVAGFLLQITEREARIEAELSRFKEKHSLNLKLQVERHDFYNHLTAVYGYFKAGQFGQAECYIENLYKNVRYIKELLNIDPPELAALLCVKQEQAKSLGIKFLWEIDVQNSVLPLSPEDFTHLIGNLLDNAIEAAAPSLSPKIDLKLVCNNLGLRLYVSNSGSPIPQHIKNSIFTAGYTTKDTNQHCGLGLYIIRQIIDRHGGHLEINDPSNYSGTAFDIYIPWNNNF